MWGLAERKGGLGGWIDLGVLGGEWTRESGVGWFEGVGLMSKMYLVSVGGGC